MASMIRLSRAQWVIVGAFLGIVFPLLLVLVFIPVVTDWYVVATVAPALERDLGFRAERANHPGFPGRETFHVVAVSPGGIFQRAGIQPGDVPLDVHHGRADFYGLLQRHRGTSVKVRVLRIPPGPSGSFPVEHLFEVPVPR